ncbi:MAG: beta-propeller repeat-containing protein [Herminiimonas sp.]|nr:beta-propeller repeat-containing protein [Herminiimonas sp.]MDB5856259.1 beta-propeller repeat-containing protein [Herminiimonas sp.]
MSTKTLFQLLFAMCALGTNAVHAVQSSSNAKFSLSSHYVVGGEGRWDLFTFDAKHHRLFISRSSHVQVVDTDSRKVVGDIPDTDGVHGIALAEDLNVGFTSNGKSNSVTVFDLTTLKVLDTIKISGANPDVILYDPASKHVFTFNGQSNDASVIDAVSHKEIAKISLSGKPELAVANNAGKVFVNIEDKNEIVVIDTRSNQILKTYALGTGKEPTGLAIDVAHNRLFSVCGNNKMIILDTETGRIVAEVPVGSSPDSAAFDPKLGLAFSSNGKGTLTIVKERDPNHFSVSQNVRTKKGARTLAYDPDQHRVFLVTASFGKAPPATREQPKSRPAILPGTFEVLVVSPKR